MITLTEFDLHKLYGYIYSSLNRYEKAIEEFDKALKIKEDGQVFFQTAYCFAYLKDYQTAQKCSLKAIKLGYDAYDLYQNITWGNLRDYGATVRVLKEGIDKHISSACLAYSSFVDGLEKPEYLELAFEYAKPSEKGFVAYLISRTYKVLQKSYPALFTEDKSLYYLNISQEYGFYSKSNKYLIIDLFNESVEKNNHGVIQTMFDSFNTESKLIFLFMLLEKQYRETNEVEIDKKSIIYLLIYQLAKDDKNHIAKLLKAYADSVPLDEMRSLFYKTRSTDLIIPNYYKEAFDLFLEAYTTIMMDIEA